MFEPYLKSFYIRSTDPTQIKVLKVTEELSAPRLKFDIIMSPKKFFFNVLTSVSYIETIVAF